MARQANEGRAQYTLPMYYIKRRRRLVLAKCHCETLKSARRQQWPENTLDQTTKRFLPPACEQPVSKYPTATKKLGTPRVT